jgi:hypothetical protein
LFHYRQVDGLRLAHLEEGADARGVFISLTSAVAKHSGVTAGPVR